MPNMLPACHRMRPSGAVAEAAGPVAAANLVLPALLRRLTPSGGRPPGPAQSNQATMSSLQNCN